MKFYLAGVNHFDPLGRKDLKLWLQNLAHINREPPAFIAIEYDADQFNRIIVQRGRFRGLLQGQWPGLSSAELDILESSLAYEGDTHLEVFPDVKPLWLDSGRPASQNAIDRFADSQFMRLVGYSGGQWPGSIKGLSELIRAATEQGIDNIDRSRIFAQQIQNRAANGGGDWAIVITGSAHTREDVPVSMVSLLKNAGFTCKVDVLWSE